MYHKTEALCDIDSCLIYRSGELLLFIQCSCSIPHLDGSSSGSWVVLYWKTTNDYDETTIIHFVSILSSIPSLPSPCLSSRSLVLSRLSYSELDVQTTTYTFDIQHNRFHYHINHLVSNLLVSLCALFHTPQRQCVPNQPPSNLISFHLVYLIPSHLPRLSHPFTVSLYVVLITETNQTAIIAELICCTNRATCL